jgi:dTDP-4-amino-4,6-dideoxygalactose transaminase
MPVPFLDLKTQNRALEADLKAAFERVLHSGHYILGAELDAFEKQVAALTDARHAIGVSSGTDAILLALMTLGIGPGDEVLCPTFTFFATAGCIARTGATPVFVDSCPLCFNLDVADAARKVTPRTKAIIPVHLFGQAAEMDAVLALARRHNLAVIEDAAQALGASYRGRRIGSLGTFAIFSFFPSKNLGGFGDAGMLVTNDAALADKARLLRTHGSRPKYYHKLVGGNFRMDPLQAALLAVKLPHLAEYTKCRRANAAYYTDRLSKLPGVGLADLAESRCLQCGGSEHPTRSAEGTSLADARQAGDQGSTLKSEIRIVLPAAYPHNDHIWNQYTLRVPEAGQRDALKHFLSDRAIGTEIYYPVPMHQQECFAYLASRAAGPASTCPVASRLATECLSLPIYPELARAQQDEVIAAVQEFLRRG